MANETTVSLILRPDGEVVVAAEECQKINDWCRATGSTLRVEGKERYHTFPVLMLGEGGHMVPGVGWVTWEQEEEILNG